VRWRASQAVATSSSGLWPSIFQAQGLIRLLLATWGPLPLLELVPQGVGHLASFLKRHGLSLAELLGATLLMGTRNVLGVIARPQSCVYRSTYLLDVWTLLILLWLIVLLLSTWDGASYEIWTCREKLTFNLGDLFHFESTIFNALLDPLHLGGRRSLRRSIASAWRHIRPLMLGPLLRSLLLDLPALILLILSDPWTLRRLQSLHLTVLLMSLRKCDRIIICLWRTHIIIAEELA
jgi:hypothetical protein